MRFEVLGHLRARADSRGGDEAALGGPKQRLVLALLLARPNEVVSTDRLIDEVWGDDAPGTARHTLQGYVSELRKVIGASLERTGPGYLMRVDAATMDALEFERLVSDGVSRLNGDPEGAAAQLREALELWHGAPFSDFEHHDALVPEIARLEELHLSAEEHLVRAELALGHHHVMIGVLEQLTRAHPYREELRALHMLALYRSGRQADALRAYQRTRRFLGEELGIEPSPALARLEEQILVQDPALELAPTAAPPAELAHAAAPTVNPYKGLQAFRERDRDAFFGRTTLIDQILRALDGEARMVTVVGPSGAGKSSVIAAGVVPRWRELHTAERVLVATVHPGAHPFADLESALARAMDGHPGAVLRDGETGLLRAVLRVLPDESSRLLLVIDQFEELFTLVGEDEREQFLQSVVTAASDSRHRIQILVSLRADFYDRPLRHRELAPLITEHVVHVLPLTTDELEAAALQPAGQAGLTIEPRLLGALIADVRDQPHALPLFQYALTELYDRREGSTLTFAGYQSFGGLRRAVANRADQLFASLDAEQQEAARQLFLRLIAVAGDAEGRRQILASELTALEVDVVALQAAIHAFSRHRLLSLDRDPTTGSPTIEVAHEALLSEWGLLRDWIDQARTDLRTHRGFAAAVAEWRDAGRDPEFLLSGGRLAEYERWAASTILRLTTDEREFLDEAIARREAATRAEAARQAKERRLRRRARVRTWALAAAVAALVGVGAAAIVARNTADGKGPTVGMVGFDRSTGAIDILAMDGIERAARDHHIQPLIIGNTVTDAVESLAQAADGAGLVVVGLRQPLTPELVAGHPHTRFVVLDPFAIIPGATGVSFAVNEGSFLVGAAAALESKTGKVGFLGGEQIAEIESFRAGFEAGARAADPDVEVLAAYVMAGDPLGFDSPELGEQVATTLYERGADVVFHAAGNSGAGVFQAAQRQSDALGRKLWAIGVDSDEYLRAPSALQPYILTSMVKRYDQAVYETVQSYLDHKLRPGRNRLGLAEGGVGYSTSGNHLAASTIERLESMRQEIVSGRRIVPRTPSGPLDAPLGFRDPERAPVSWNGRECKYDGRPEWELGNVARLDITNTASTGIMVWAVSSDDPAPRVSVEVPPGGRALADVVITRGSPPRIMCYPMVNDEVTAGAGVEAVRLDVRPATPGHHEADLFGVPFSFSVPEGWHIDDERGQLFLGPQTWDAWWPVFVLTDVGAADQTCKLAHAPGVGRDAASIATWLSKHAGLTTTTPEPVTLGGLSGRVLTITQRADWAETCEELDSHPVVSLLTRPYRNGVLAWRQWEAMGWTTKIWLLDHPTAGTIAVITDVKGDQAKLDEASATVKKVLDTFSFTA